MSLICTHDKGKPGADSGDFLNRRVRFPCEGVLSVYSCTGDTYRVMVPFVMKRDKNQPAGYWEYGYPKNTIRSLHLAVIF